MTERTPPEGWQMVPVEPTEEMIEALAKNRLGYYDIKTTMGHMYRAMLAASPTPAAPPNPVPKIEITEEEGIGEDDDFMEDFSAAPPTEPSGVLARGIYKGVTGPDSDSVWVDFGNLGYVSVPKANLVNPTEPSEAWDAAIEAAAAAVAFVCLYEDEGHTDACLMLARAEKNIRALKRGGLPVNYREDVAQEQVRKIDDLLSDELSGAWVPVGPTEEMRRAGRAFIGGSSYAMEKAYRAMLAAAPRKPPGWPSDALDNDEAHAIDPLALPGDEDIDDYMAGMIVKNRMNQVWDEAIEAAAQVALAEMPLMWRDELAEAIRALKKDAKP